MANPKSAADIPISPLAFTRAYQHYRDTAARTPFADTRLLLAARFWGEYSPALGAEAFATYWREDLPPLLIGIDTQVLADLTAEELEEVAAFVECTTALLADISKGQDSPAPAIWELAARHWLYLGQVERAFAALMKRGVFAVPSEEETATVSEGAGSSEAVELPEFLAERLNDDYTALAGWLRSFGSSWKIGSDSGYHDTAHCLLVEYDPNGRPVRGRLRRLTAKIEERRKGADTDEVVFHHQLKSPDDPFVGTVYNALTALRQHRAGHRAKTDGHHLRGRFEITGDGSETYGGNSIGLAAFAAAYGSWWNSEIHRERQLIGHSVAFTGAIENTGDIQPIAEESLALKVERAFRSPLTYLVVPEANRKTAEQVAQTLRERYPRRRLQIIGTERLSDILTDHNILRPEKVCPAEFVYRKAGKYSRSVKVQVPMLLAMLYILVCIVYPKAWVGFDWNPEYVKVTETGFEVLNADSTSLWSVDYACSEIEPTESRWKIGDLDRDGKNEVAFSPKVIRSETCESNAKLFVYNHKGKELFQRQCVILGEYPGDTSLQQDYTSHGIDFVDIGDSTIILTMVNISYPGRCHICLWSSTGDSLGWYINAGYGSVGLIFLTKGKDGLFFLCFNNRMSSVGFLGLMPYSSYGVSPPYQDPVYDLTNVRRGNQICYIVFPRSDLNKALNRPYNSPFQLVLQPEGFIRVDIWEHHLVAELAYTVNRDYRVSQIKASTRFYSERDRMVNSGKLNPVDWGQYLAKMHDSVKYWIDSGWVTEAELRAAENN